MMMARTVASAGACRPRFSVVVCSIDPWRHAQSTVMFRRLLADFPHEIITIHDAKSLCSGYNRGLKRASGDIVIFSHDDVRFLDRNFASKLDERMRDWDLLGFAGATRLTGVTWFGEKYPCLRGAVSHATSWSIRSLTFTIYGMEDWPVSGGIMALDGLCLIARREVAATIGFDDKTFDGWHCYDVDFSFRVARAGYRVGVCGDMPYIHAHDFMSRDGVSAFSKPGLARATGRFARKFPGVIQPGIREGKLPGAGCVVSGYEALIDLWQEETVRRAMVGIDRRFGGAGAALRNASGGATRA